MTRSILILILSALLLAGSASDAELEMPAIESLMAHDRSLRLKVETLAHQVSVTPQGSAAYSFPIEVLPALAQPALALSYGSSSRLPDPEMPRGWSIAGLLEIRPDRRTEDRFWISGVIEGRLDRSLHQLPGGTIAYSLSTTGSGAVVISYKPADRQWTVRTAQDRWQLLQAQHAGGGDEVGRWRVAWFEDVHGNRIDFDRQGSRLDLVRFGGNPGIGEEHPLCVDFNYVDRLHERPTGAHGAIEPNDRILESIEVGEFIDWVGPSPIDGAPPAP